MKQQQIVDPSEFSLLPESPPEGKACRVPLVGLPEIEDHPSPVMRQSVAEWGVIEPVVLREGDDGSLEVVDGRRRIAAARAANLFDVPAIIHTKDLEADILTLVLNSVRGPNVVGEFVIMRGLYGQGMSEAAIARLSGLPVATVRKRLKLLSLTAPLLDGFMSGSIAPGVAEKAATLPLGRQQLLKEILHDTGKVTTQNVVDVRRVGVVTSTQSLLDDMPMPEPRTSLEDLVKEFLNSSIWWNADPSLIEWERRLQSAVGA